MIASLHKLQLFQIPSTSLFSGVEWQLPLPLVPKLTLTSARRQHPRTPHPPLHGGLDVPPGSPPPPTTAQTPVCPHRN
jgi:hypothetical protein